MGLALSFYGAFLITENLTQQIENVGEGETLTVSTYLDPLMSVDGVYVVQSMDVRGISFTLLDPFGSVIRSEFTESDSIEGYFEIESAGEYILLVENTGEPVELVGAVGHLPDETLFSVGITGFFFTIAGLAGMAVIGVRAFLHRRRIS